MNENASRSVDGRFWSFNLNHLSGDSGLSSLTFLFFCLRKRLGVRSNGTNGSFIVFVCLFVRLFFEQLM